MNLLLLRPSILALTCAAALLAGCGSTPPAPKVERVVVLGDSNVDTGNLYRLTGNKLPAPPNWSGRNANGPVVVEYLAEALGAKLESHAVSGATSGPSNIVARVLPAWASLERTGVTEQLDKLAAGNSKFTPSDLVVLWAGSNDIFGATRAKRDELDQRIASASANVETAISRLHAMGARRFVVANRTPRDVIGSDNDLNGVDLNTALVVALDRARQKTNADIRLYDAYGAVADMMKKPEAYGFKDVKTLCISVPACAQDSAEAGYPIASAYVNWDGAHKTTRVHKLMAAQIQQLVQR